MKVKGNILEYSRLGCHLVFWWTFFGIALYFEDVTAVFPSQSETVETTTSLVAILDMNGFRGAIEFHSNPSKKPFEEVLIHVNVIGLSEGDKLTWFIRERPTDLTQDDPCNPTKLGKELVNLSELYGYVKTGKESLIRDTLGVLGVVNLFERTLVIKSIQYGLKACTLIRSSLPVRTMEARFLSPIGGSFILRQLPQVATGVRTNLFWTSGENTHNSRLRWSIVAIRQDTQKHQYEERLFSQRSCSYLWELIASGETTPLHVSKTMETSISVGGTGDASPDSSIYIVETDFTSLEGLDLTDVWVVLQWSEDEFVACAPLLEVLPREAIAEFRQPSYMTGYVHFYQASGYGDGTVVTVNLTAPKRNGAGFGIDDLTLWPTTSGFRQECLGLGLKYFNPLKSDSQSSPLPLDGTTDRYPIGDLSGKMGSLSDQREFYGTFYNQYVTMFGPNGVMGRSIVIFEDSWYPLACSNLLSGHEELIATATFNGVLSGKVIFHQRIEEPLGADTSLHVNLRYKNQTDSTKNHKWKILSPMAPVRRQRQRRRQRTSQRKATNPRRCRGGSVYNPYGVVFSPCDCRQTSGVRCALGDLSGRLGYIDIEQSKEAAVIMGNDVAGGRFLVDSGLWLNSDLSVVGMSLVVYNSDYGNEILDCATIVSSSNG